MDRPAFQTACAGLALELDDAQLATFESFEAALYEANVHMNLTRVPRDECWLRHFVDSLLLAEFIPRNASVLDLGSGPGFPAWPLACARPDLKVTALDSNGKMVAFLQSRPLANLGIVHARAEDAPARERYDVVTGRAVAPLAIQLELSAAPCRVGGRVLPMRTVGDEPLADAPSGLGLTLAAVHRRTLPGTDAVRVFPDYLKVFSTAGRFPRRWAEIRKSSRQST